LPLSKTVAAAAALATIRRRRPRLRDSRWAGALVCPRAEVMLALKKMTTLRPPRLGFVLFSLQL
jgi:hypothetical protein